MSGRVGDILRQPAVDSGGRTTWLRSGSGNQPGLPKVAYGFEISDLGLVGPIHDPDGNGEDSVALHYINLVSHTMYHTVRAKVNGHASAFSRIASSITPWSAVSFSCEAYTRSRMPGSA